MVRIACCAVVASVAIVRTAPSLARPRMDQLHCQLPWRRYNGAGLPTPSSASSACLVASPPAPLYPPIQPLPSTL